MLIINCNNSSPPSAHKALCDQGILHHDISVCNVLVTMTQDALLRGFITDLEFACIVLIPLFFCDQNNIDRTAYNLCYKMWGTIRCHKLHKTNTHKLLYHLYFIHSTSLTSCNYILQTNTMHFCFGHILVRS